MQRLLLLVAFTGSILVGSASKDVKSQTHDAIKVPKLAVSADGQTAYIAQFTAGKLVRLTASELERGEEAIVAMGDLAAGNVTDMQLSPSNEELLLVCDQPARLMRQPLTDGKPETVPLPSRPFRIALNQVASGQQSICISLPAANAVWISRFSQGKDILGETLSLSFSPKEVLALREHLFLVADAVGNRLALIDAEANRVAKSFVIDGYHISGMAIDMHASSLLLSHQLLSSNARTDKDDIRWGNLIQNNIASIPLTMLAKTASRLTSDVRYRLGNFGHGSADPAGVVGLGEQVAVAIAGTDEVALYSKAKHQPKFVGVGHVPERIFKFGDNRLLCLHRLDSRIAVIDCSNDVPKLERMLGEEQPITTAEQRGELAYFSGRLSHESWMSCNSCHVEGSTPDLLVDTKGDGSFDTPKKIPSLGNVSHSGPWAWNGSQHLLSDQIDKTLGSTMHAPDEFASSALSRETVVQDLVAYLSTMRPTSKSRSKGEAPTDSDSHHQLAAGEALFQQHCAKCHDPEHHFTTPRSYDVGLNDERGQKLFNPPSLIDVANRVRFMHDGRFATLDEVLASHPLPAIHLTESERSQLKQYLQGL